MVEGAGCKIVEGTGCEIVEGAGWEIVEGAGWEIWCTTGIKDTEFLSVVLLATKPTDNVLFPNTFL
jgi:hypothetical protein